MFRILVPLGSCSEALAVAPLLAAFAERGLATTVAWFGSEDGLSDARDLGLPGPQFVGAPDVGAGPGRRFAQAAAFASDLLARGPWSALLCSGHGTTALAAAAVAGRVGVPIAHLGAGQRSHDPLCAVERSRREADHAASAWFVASELQRQELLREGLPAAQVRVVGSTLPAALRNLPRARAATSPYLWLAIEHEATVADRQALATLLANVAAAASAPGLPVRAAATVLAPALERLALPLPDGIRLEAASTARAQLDAARGAAAVLTDSAGHQELAAVTDVPCLLLARSTARPETVAAGACTIAGPTAADAAPALARALAAPRAAQALYADAVPAIVDELPRLLAPSPSPASPPARVATLPSDADHTGRTLGDDEVALVAAAVRSGTLNSTKGTFVARFEKQFARWLGRRHAIACASGSAAVHCAIAAIGLQPGDEVITTPITDMGALTPILYEGGVPVFADVDPNTLNVTAATIRAQLTSRTRAIVVTHLFGLPCDLAPILALAEERALPVVEDSAQAFGATCGPGKVGTLGTLAAFSLQQGKHITCGEGGIVATDDDALARRVFLCVNKAWGYGDKQPDHYFPALNYRLSELQGAVAEAQLPKLDWVVARRREVAAALRRELAAVPGLSLPHDPPHGRHSYWKFAFFVDPRVIGGGAQALGRRMQTAGVACAPRYIQKPAFECALFADWRKSPVTWMPLQNNPRRDGPMPLFTRAAYPGAVQALERVVVLPINERYAPADVSAVAGVIRAAAAELQHA